MELINNAHPAGFARSFFLRTPDNVLFNMNYLILKTLCLTGGGFKPMFQGLLILAVTVGAKSYLINVGKHVLAFAQGRVDDN